MQLNETQLQYLRHSAELIIEDPLKEMTVMWMDWANDNIDNVLERKARWCSAENILPVIWVFSAVTSVAPKAVFAIMRHVLSLRVLSHDYDIQEDLTFTEASVCLDTIMRTLQAPSGNKTAKAQ